MIFLVRNRFDADGVVPPCDDAYSFDYEVTNPHHPNYGDIVKGWAVEVNSLEGIWNLKGRNGRKIIICDSEENEEYRVIIFKDKHRYENLKLAHEFDED